MAKPIPPIEIATPFKLYRPARQCIYCLRRAAKLSKEHVIAFGLASDSLVLPASSCTRCRNKTQAYETVCLRHMWWPFRTNIGAPSRGKEKPESFEIRRTIVTRVDEETGVIDYRRGDVLKVPPSEYPLYYMAFRFPPPGILLGRNTSNVVDVRPWAVHCPEDFKKLGLGDKEGLWLAPGGSGVGAFTRLLAKTAHAYAAAELGTEAFEPTLARYIRHRAEKALHWIGSAEEIPPRQPGRLHDIRWRVQQIDSLAYLVVDLRLFSFLGTPQYHVIVGKLKCALDQLPFLEQPLYTIDIKPPFPSRELVPIADGRRVAWSESL